MVGGHHVLEEVDSRRHGTFGFVCSDPREPQLPTPIAHVFLRRRRAAEMFKDISEHSLVFVVVRKHEQVCDEVSLVPGRRAYNVQFRHFLAELISTKEGIMGATCGPEQITRKMNQSIHLRQQIKLRRTWSANHLIPTSFD